MTLYRLTCANGDWTGYRVGSGPRSAHKSGAGRCPECRGEQVRQEAVPEGEAVMTAAPNGQRLGWDWTQQTWVAA